MDLHCFKAFLENVKISKKSVTEFKQIFCFLTLTTRIVNYWTYHPPCNDKIGFQLLLDTAEAVLIRCFKIFDLEEKIVTSINMFIEDEYERLWGYLKLFETWWKGKDKILKR